MGKLIQPEWLKTPTCQGLWWHWNGDDDDAPIPLEILRDETKGCFFVSAMQYGLGHAMDCEDYGGWWLRAEVPQIPRRCEKCGCPASGCLNGIAWLCDPCARDCGVPV